MDLVDKIFLLDKSILNDQKLVKRKRWEKLAAKSKAGDHGVEDLLLVGVERAGWGAIPDGVDVPVEADRGNHGVFTTVGIGILSGPGVAANLPGAGAADMLGVQAVEQGGICLFCQPIVWHPWHFMTSQDDQFCIAAVKTHAGQWQWEAVSRGRGIVVGPGTGIADAKEAVGVMIGAGRNGGGGWRRRWRWRGGWTGRCCGGIRNAGTSVCSIRSRWLIKATRKEQSAANDSNQQERRDDCQGHCLAHAFARLRWRIINGRGGIVGICALWWQHASRWRHVRCGGIGGKRSWTLLWIRRRYERAWAKLRQRVVGAVVPVGKTKGLVLFGHRWGSIAGHSGGWPRRRVLQRGAWVSNRLAAVAACAQFQCLRVERSSTVGTCCWLAAQVTNPFARPHCLVWAWGWKIPAVICVACGDE